MSSNYEFYLTDDAGRRITLLKNFAYASYSKSARGYGVIQFGLPLEEYLQFVPIVFAPDWRIDVWRSPGKGYPKRRESSYLLRKYRVYTRKTDGVQMIEFFGRSPIDILRRWSVYSVTEADYKKTDFIDDMMKSIVTQEFITGGHVVPSGEFSVDGNLGLGPTITSSFLGKTVLDILTNLKATSFTLNDAASTNRKIYFDVVDGPGLTNGFGYIFRTYADLRGIDRTNGLVFSVENGNLSAPEYYENYLDEITVAQVCTTQVSSADVNLSRWNNILEYRYSSSGDVDAETALANQMLSEGKADVSLGAQFLDTPGSTHQPRSLYGIDWDLGDLLSVQYAGKNLETEVEIVWISVDENGQENIVGSNKVGT